MREKAIVLESDGEKVKIAVLRHGACAKCGRCASGGENTFVFEDNTILSPGDVVEIEMGGGILIVSSILVYLFPLFGFFGGYLAGVSLARLLSLSSFLEEAGIISALAFLLISFPFLRFLGGWMEARGLVKPRIVRVFHDGSQI